jgi:SAM-dependent methyltransferase
MDVRAHNRMAWDRQVEGGNRWTVPVGPQVTEAARKGEWEILLTPTRPVPRSWFPQLSGRDVLCLASGGGQQGPVMAAAGAKVTVLDNSPLQLSQDRMVAERDGLEIITVLGDMADLRAFPDGAFDLIVHPVSNIFAPEVRPVWAEAFRLLRSGGALLAGIANPVIYLFDLESYERGELQVRYSLPYSDIENLPEAVKLRYIEEGEPFEFSHTLEEQIGGQIEAGFMIAGFYEDYDDDEQSPLRKYMPTFIATRAIKP